jgi:hypothetical protein
MIAERGAREEFLPDWCAAEEDSSKVATVKFSGIAA